MVQHLQVVQGGRDKADVFDGVLYHFSCSLVEDNVSHLYANIFCQTKCSCVQERIKITQQRKKQVKFKNVASRLI
jgi:hypothetical protein